MSDLDARITRLEMLLEALVALLDERGMVSEDDLVDRAFSPRKDVPHV